MLCPTCESSEMHRKKVPFYFRNIYFGDYDADVCQNCGEILFTEEASRKMDKKAKSLGVWGIDNKKIV